MISLHVFVSDFVAVISSQGEGLGKLALGIVKIYLGSPFSANRRCSRSVCSRSVGLRSVVVDPSSPAFWSPCPTWCIFCPQTSIKMSYFENAVSVTSKKISFLIISSFVLTILVLACNNRQSLFKFFGDLDFYLFVFFFLLIW